MGNSKHISYTTSPFSLFAAERVALEEDARLAYVAHARCAWRMFLRRVGEIVCVLCDARVLSVVEYRL